MGQRWIDSSFRTLVLVALSAGCGGKEPSGPPPPPPPPPTPTQLAFVVQPSQALIDSLMTPAVKVEVRGAAGTRIAGATNSVTIALGVNPGGATLGGTTSVAAADGVATFPDLHVSQRGRGFTLVATSGSLTQATSTPVNIVVPLPVDAVAIGGGHACGEVGNGLYCWGSNANGELGNGTLTSSALPVQVPFSWPGGAAVSHVAVGASHTCATTSVAEMYCWGSDSSGQLGIGSQNDRRTSPMLVSGVSFSGVTAGRAHTCGISVPSPDSTYVYCWGANDRGQVGDSSNAQRTAPAPVAPKIAFSSVTAGEDHTCAIATATGAAFCWGDNTNGQLGDSSTNARNSPVPVAGGHSFIEISAGGNHTCGVTGALTVYCWGENSDGQLGDSSTGQHTIPVLVTGGLSLVRIAVGGEFSCAIANDAKEYCWGRNLEGELGLGTLTSHLTPQPVGGNLNPFSIVAGDRQACALPAGVAYCWGANPFGVLGDGTTSNRPSPVLIVY
jgi:alpha-tubulin suppressor-like RCC1 family protein